MIEEMFYEDFCKKITNLVQSWESCPFTSRFVYSREEAIDISCKQGRLREENGRETRLERERNK